MVTANQLQILQSPITGLISSVSTSVTVKLDETNYLQWHFQMQLMLEVHGLMGFVDGSNLFLAQFSSTSSGDSEVTSATSCSRIETDEYKVWKMHDHSLMLLITATLSSSAISCVIGSKSSQEMWVRLQNEFFVPITRTSIIKLQTDLYNIKKGSDSVSQYLRRIKEARDALSILGVTFPNEDFVIIALNGLPPKYNTFKCVRRGRESIISLKDFRAQLLVEEAIVDCALVECETKGSLFPLFSSQFHAGFNDCYVASSGLPDETRAARQILKDYIDGKLPHYQMPPGMTEEDAVGNSLSEQHKSDSSENEHFVNDEGEDEPELDHVLEDLNSFDLANGLATKKKVTVRKPTALHKQHKNHETPLQSNSNVEIHTAYDHQSGFLSYFIVSEDEMCLDDAEKQVLEYIDKDSADSQLILVGLQLYIQVIFPVLNSDNKAKIGVPTQTVVHEFRGFYVLRLCKGGSIFDTQLGYHMRISDKGGGPTFLFRSIYLGCTLRMISSLVAGLLGWLLQFELEFLIAIIRLLVQLVGRIQSIFKICSHDGHLPRSLLVQFVSSS